VGCLAALLGALVGMAVGVALTFALLVGAEADSFSWLAVFVIFGFVGGLLGATAALVWRDIRKRRRRNFVKPS
jgi:amino acid transporter